MLIPMAAAGLKSNAATTTGLVLPTTGSPPYVQTPDAAAFDITGDIGLVAFVRLADWTPASDNQVIVSKWPGSAGYVLAVLQTSGLLNFAYHTGSGTRQTQSSVAPTVSDGGALWIGVARDQSAGEVKFWTGGSGETSSWSQLGSTQSSPDANAMATNAEPVEVGSHTEANVGRATSITLYHSRIYNGIGAFTAPDQGTAVGSPDFTTEWTDNGGLSYTDAQGNTWTIAGTGFSWE